MIFMIEWRECGMEEAIQTKRKKYPSDISDHQWEQIKSILPRRSNMGRPVTVDLREIVNALAYLWRTGCPWRLLPHDLPHYSTVRMRYDIWQRDGVLEQIREIVEK